MKILLDFGFGYFINARTGVGKYEENIIFGLKNKYDIIALENSLAPLPENANPIYLCGLRKKLSRIIRFLFSADYLYKNYDVVITGSACYRKSRNVKQIPIVHDLMSFTEPQNYTLKKRFENWIAAKSLKNAYKIIAVSNTTKQALHDLFKIDFNLIYVLPNITDFYLRERNPKDFLFIGDMRKTKNLDYLIKGFHDYKLNYHSEERLIIAGNKKFEFENLQTIVKNLNLDKDVIFTGYVDECEKIKLFSNAKGLVFISNNEGFGIPLLEANVNCIPVLCSDIPVFHEVISEQGGVFVNNKDIKAISSGMFQLQNFKIRESYSLELRNRYSKKIFSELLENLINSISPSS